MTELIVGQGWMRFQPRRPLDISHVWRRPTHGAANGELG
jgi:hypothetical protein